MLCLAPRPVCVTHGFAQRAQAACLVGTRFASAQRLICASRVIHGSRAPAHPRACPIRAASARAGLTLSRSVGRALPSAPEGLPDACALRAKGSTQNPEQCAPAARTAQRAKVWHAVQGELTLPRTAATSVFSLDRCQGRALRVRAVARSLDTRRHRCSSTKKQQLKKVESAKTLHALAACAARADVGALRALT